MTDHTDAKVDPESLIARHIAHFDEQLALGQVVTRLESPPAGVSSTEWQRYLEARQLLLSLRGAKPDTDQLHWDSPPDDPRYSVIHELGQGGFATVFLAKDNRLKRLVALKVPRIDSLLRDDLRQRFLREGESTARLSHPHIVQVFEAVAEGSFSLIVSEYVPGPNLATWIVAHPGHVSPRQAAQFLLPLVDAVAHAHARGVLHRDIKPSNILLAPHPASADSPADIEAWQPKLADFGIAKLLESQDLTHSGAILGTPCYMAPEQIAGHSSAIGPAVDLYALGMVLYVLLTGSNPLSKTSVHETVLAVAQAELPSLRKLRHDIPRDLETICFKCLRQNPKERYASASDLFKDLQSFLEGRPIQARSTSISEQVLKWCRRNPALAAVGSMTFALLLSLVIGYRIYNARLLTALEMADKNATNAAAEARKAQLKTREAQEHGEALLRRAYLDDIQMAGQAWHQSNTTEVLKRLERYLPNGEDKDVRTFPWWVMWRSVKESSEVLTNHRPEATAVAVNESGTLAATGGAEGVIRIWKFPDRSLSVELKGHEKGPIQSLQFHRAGEDDWLLSAAEDGTARLWNLTTSTELKCLRHKDWLPVARFVGPKADRIVTGGADGIIRLWETGSGKLLSELKGHTHAVRSLAEKVDGHLLFSSSEDGTVRAWNWQSGEPDARLKGGTFRDFSDPQQNWFWSSAISTSHDGKYLTAGFREGHILTWSLEPNQFGKIKQRWKVEGPINTLEWRNSEGLVVGANQSLLITQQPLDPTPDWKQLHGLQGRVMSLKLFPQSKEILTAEKTGAVRFWPQQTVDGQLPSPCQEQVRDTLEQPRWTGPYLSRRTGSRFYDVYHVPNPTPLHHLNIDPEQSLPGLNSWHAPLPGGTGIILVEKSRADFALSAWQKDSQSVPPKPGLRRVWKTALSNRCPDNGTCNPAGDLIAVTANLEVWILQTKTGDLLSRLKHPDAANVVAFTPEGKSLFTTCSDGLLREWNVADWTKRAEQVAHAGAATALSISTDGRLIATCGNDLRAKVWNRKDLTEVASFPLPTQALEVSILDAGETLCAVTDSARIGFWSIKEQREIFSMEGNEGKNWISFSPDRKWLAIQAPQYDSTIRLIHGTKD